MHRIQNSIVEDWKQKYMLGYTVIRTKNSLYSSPHILSLFGRRWLDRLQDTDWIVFARDLIPVCQEGIAPDSALPDLLPGEVKMKVTQPDLTLCEKLNRGFSQHEKKSYV